MILDRLEGSGLPGFAVVLGFGFLLVLLAGEVRGLNVTAYLGAYVLGVVARGIADTAFLEPLDLEEGTDTR